MLTPENSSAVLDDSPRPERILSSVQVLRALAAWSVVIHHYCMIFAVQNPSWWRRGFLENGSLGVDLFFVVSGFVMGLSASDPGVTPRVFIAKRIARIVPAYWLVTIIVACLIYFTTNVMPNQGYSPTFLIQSLLFIPAQNPSGLGLLPINTVGWTVHLEVVFYLIVAASLFIRLPQRWIWIVVAIVILQMVLAPLGYVSSLYGTTLLYEFLLGLVAAHLFKAGVLRGPAWAYALLALTGIALLIRAPIGTLAQGLDCGIPAFLILCGFVGCEPYLRRASLLVRMGDHSYSVYLIHPAMLYVSYYLYKLTHVRYGVISILCLAAIALVGAASYRFVERPAGRWLTRLLR